MLVYHGFEQQVLQTSWKTVLFCWSPKRSKLSEWAVYGMKTQLKVFKVIKWKFEVENVNPSNRQCVAYIQNLMTETAMKSWKKSCWQAVVLFVIDVTFSSGKSSHYKNRLIGLEDLETC